MNMYNVPITTTTLSFQPGLIEYTRTLGLNYNSIKSGSMYLGCVQKIKLAITGKGAGNRKFTKLINNALHDVRPGK